MAQKKSTLSYKNRMVTKTTPQGRTAIKIHLSEEQYSQLAKIAFAANLSIDQVVQRYIARCIADLSAP